MEREGETRSRGYEAQRLDQLTRIGGMLSAVRIDPIIQRLWKATGDISLLKRILQWEIQERPELKRVLENVIELESKSLVTACTIVKVHSEK